MQVNLVPFTIGNDTVSILVPDAKQVQSLYKDQPTPYWAQVWHAAIGLATFLQQHPSYIHHKNVLELGAGLGLPGIVAATTAKQVSITDQSAAAVAIVQQTVQHFQLLNVDCVVADWKDARSMAIPDVVLLSDVNYEPEVFEALLSVIRYYLEHQCTIVLSTPQRLMAKPFIEVLLPYCTQQETFQVSLREKMEAISVFVLVME